MINRVKLKITGKNPNYFLNELIKRNINIYYLEKDYKSLTIIVDYSSFIEIENIKTTYEIKLINLYGLSKVKYLVKRYSLLLSLLIIGVLLNIFLSNIIFNIEIPHPNKEIRKVVLKDLEALGLKKYHFKRSYKKIRKIKEELLKKEKDLIEWIEIDEEGTKYIVRLEEKKINKKKSKCLPRNIISKKNALVLNIKAETGEIKVKKNDYVESGEVLVSGIIYNKEDAVSKVCARGKVYGEVWYKVDVVLPEKKEIVKKLNKNSFGISLKYLNKNYDFKKRKQIIEKSSYNIIDSNFIPIKFSFVKYCKAKIIKTNYQRNEIDTLALQVAEKEILKKLKKEEKILGKKVLKKRIKNSKIDIEVFIRVYENINSYQDISNIKLDDLNKKEE